MNFSLIALIVSNLIPLVGVLLWDWSLFSIMALYWMENVVIGLWNVVKILSARGSLINENMPEEARAKLREQIPKGGDRIAGFFLAPFFLVHYGMFTLIHGVFVFAIFGNKSGGGSGGLGLFALPQTVFQDRMLLIAMLALVVSHGISYFANFIGKGEFRRVNAGDMMKAPYSRIVVLHLTIIFGGGGVMILGEPLFALLLLIVLKTGVDITAHRRSHLKMQEQLEELAIP